ncbi:unnamed protein product [Ostreobium quekettii]|uniref:Cns1/TTC4 wheel domain-containing protein n=1 Tax=Ostreobium quekettii TaxID=121088 RepID=A0A8S1J7U8_9CHLO|nr:unnamed protein product [Ostreobium quekettii]
MGDGMRNEGPSNEELPALFWDETPERPEEHPDYAALEALREESTPEENAENYKNQGNERIRVANKLKKKFYFQEAIKYYTKGIDIKCKDDNLVSTLYGNRAQGELLLGNWRRALNDARQAIEINPNNLKAYYRAAKAALKLSEAQVAIQMCEAGLALDPGSTDLQKMLEDARRRHGEFLAAQEKKRKQREDAEKLAAAMMGKGIKFCPEEYKVAGAAPRLDESGLVHLPLLFIYPETMQRDVVQDACEADTLAEHLDVMFGEGVEPLPWDAKREYVRSNIELYYLAHAGAPLTQSQLASALEGESAPARSDAGPRRYGKNAASWVKVNERSTLLETLAAPDHVVPGAPMFFVVAGGSEYRDRFLKYGVDSL